MPNDYAKWGAISNARIYNSKPEVFTLVEDPAHCLYDPRVHNKPQKEMVASIKEKGVITPLLARRNGFDEQKQPILEVIDGRQRVINALQANKELRDEGLEEVVVQYKPITCDDETAHDLMLLANELRYDDDDVTRAEKVKVYLDRGRPIAAAQVIFGASKNTLLAYKLLAEAEKQVKQAVRDGLPMRDVKALSVMPRAKQKAVIESLRAKGLIGRGDGSLLIAKEAAAHQPAKATRLASRSPKLLGYMTLAVEEADAKLAEEDAEDASGAADILPAVRAALLWAGGGDRGPLESLLANHGITLPPDDFKPPPPPKAPKEPFVEGGK